MRNGCMEYFWSEAYWKICRNDENTGSTVYRKLARKLKRLLQNCSSLLVIVI